MQYSSTNKLIAALASTAILKQMKVKQRFRPIPSAMATAGW